MKFIALKLLLLVLLGAAFIPCTGQSEVPSQARKDFKGKVRLVTHSREYWISNGRAAPSQPVLVSQTEFDRDGKATRQSLFGNIEQRSIYANTGGKETTEVRYFDRDGLEIPAGKQPFIARVDLPITDDLCSDYTSRSEIDKKAGIRRMSETCKSGATRATIITEQNADSSYIREVREDGKGRTWETIAIYDKGSTVREQRYLVNNVKSPKYSWLITYVNHKFDAGDNLIEVVASGIHSSRPHQVWYQFVERYEFVYFD